MSPESADTSARDRLLEECIAIHGDGGDASMEAFLAEHPGEAPWIRTQLRELSELGMLERVPRFDEELSELGDFRLVRKLGEGGMGVVYLAEQRSLGRRVALKLLRPGQLHFGSARERFRREVDAVARLQHPGIVPVYLVGEHDGMPYFAMECIEGCSLADVLRALRGENPAELTGRSLAQAIAARVADAASHASSAWTFEGSWAEACVRLVQQAAEALDHAHRRGVVHRDVKPSNLMVTPTGRVLLVDFGLATTDGGSRLTRSGAQLGSLPYLSPEQVRGEVDRIGARTDVYGLGVTLYEMLTLSLPFHGESSEETMRKILEGRPARPRRKNAAVSRDLETVCMTALERDAARRYASAADLARDLGNVLQLRPIEARRAGWPLRAARFAQRHPAVAVGIALGALAVTGMLAVAAASERDKRVALERSFERSEGLRLAAISGREIDKDPALALLLAIEAAERQPGLIANNALAAALAACREIRTLEGHSGIVRAARFSPDGRTIATAGDDCEIRIRDGLTGEPRAILRGHEGSVVSLDFSSDGARFASAGSDGKACIWALGEDRPRHVLRGHRAAVTQALFTPDGARLATASVDGTARLWDVESGAELRTFDGHARGADRIAFSPDGRRLAAAASDGLLRVFDTATGACVRTMQEPVPAAALSFDPAGARLLTGGRDGKARLHSVDAPGAAFELAGHGESIRSAAFDRSGERVLTTSQDNSAVVWDSRTGERGVDVASHNRAIRGGKWSPDGRRFATFSDDRTVRIFDAATGRELACLKGHVTRVLDVDFSPDGSRLVSVGENARLWSIPPSPGPLRRAPREGRPVSARLSFDGRRAAFPLANGTTRLLDLETGEPIPDLAGHAGIVYSAAFTLDRRFVATFGVDGTARVFDAGTGECVASLAAATGAGARSGAFSPDGAKLEVATTAGRASVWDWRAGTKLLELSGHTDNVTASAWSLDGTRIATGCRDRSIRIWDAETGAQLMKFDGLRDDIISISFDRSGTRLVSCGYERAARIWDLERRELSKVIRVDDNDVFDARLSPNGKLLAMACADRTARLRDVESGREIVRDEGFSQIVAALAFPEADRVTALALDGTARSFPTDPLGEARARRPRDLTLEERIEHEVGGDAEAWQQVKRAFDAARKGALLKDEVLERLRSDATISETALARALEQASKIEDPARSLSSASWGIVWRTGLDAATYRRALPPAVEACRLAPDQPDYQRGLGIAYFRVGEFEKAIEWLLRPECRDPSEGDYDVAVSELALARSYEAAGRDADAAPVRARVESLRGRLSSDSQRALFALFGETPDGATSRTAR